MKILVLFVFLASPAFASEYRVIEDTERGRDIPVQISLPTASSFCSAEIKCPVAFLSSGYGVAYDKYTFISDLLNEAGFLVVAIQHELPGDPELAVSGDLYTERSENWARGAATLKFIRVHLQPEFSAYDFNKLTLVGHSNGGDISSWLFNEGVDFADTLITLDHRRVPLPRSRLVSVLSIRGSDYPADQGVLYTEQEMNMFKACLVSVADSKHNDMTDLGPEWLKEAISNILSVFLSGQCHGAARA